MARGVSFHGDVHRFAMAHHWVEVDFGHKVVFSDWDPYAEPRGAGLLFLIQVAGTVYPWFALGDNFGELSFRAKVACPFISLAAIVWIVATFWSLRFVLEVDAAGYLLKRYCLGVRWLRKTFPPEAIVDFLDDPFDDPPWMDGHALEISAPGEGNISFGRGKECVAFVKRIREVAQRFHGSQM
jgi:hypothetical protein